MIFKNSSKINFFKITKSSFFIENEKYKNIFFFEQNANTIYLSKMSKWYFQNFFDFIEYFFYDLKYTEIGMLNHKTIDILPNSFLEKCFTNKFYKINLNFFKFISSKNIFFSSNDSIDAYFYNELIVKYGKIPKKQLIEKYNLPDDFFTKQIELENQIHKKFWDQIPWKNDWIYDVDELYLSDPIIPFYTNQNLIDLVNSSMYPYNPIDWYLGWELKSYYHYELFFFLRDEKQQPMFEYRTTIFLWYRTIFFENNIFRDPSVWWWPDETHLFPDYYLWSSFWDMYYSYEWIKGYLDYLFDSTRLNHILFQEDGVDKLNFVIDKNFVYLWHYIWGGDHEFDYIYEYNMINWFQKLKTQILNPLANYPSMYHNLWTPYFTHFERAFYLSLFPDTAIPWGWISMFLDYWTADYNRFFHAGFTYMDGLSLLEIFWYQAAVIVWGEFDAFTEDYMAYQSIYFLDQMASLWTALIALILKNAPSKRYYELFIWNYNSVFEFTINPEYKQYLKSDLLYPLTKEQWMALFNDEAPIQAKIHQSEWLANMFFGYNVSIYINNHPLWYSAIWHSTELYWQLGFDVTNDETWEEYLDWLLLEYSTMYFCTSLKYKKYSQFYPYENNFKYFSHINMYMRYLNEKIYDDMGFFFTSLMWGENFNVWLPLLRFNDFLIKYSPNISLFHDSWMQLYSLYKSLNLHILFRYAGLTLPFYEWPDVKWKKIKLWFYETFEINWKETLVWEAFLWHWNVVNFAANCPWYLTLYFSIWLDKIFGLFFDLDPILNSNIFFFIHFFSYKQRSTFEIISTEDFIIFFLNLKRKLTGNFFIIKIFNEPIESYFNFIYEIYKSKSFQYLLNFIFKELLVTDWLLVGVSKLSFNNYKFNCATLNFFYYGPRSFPLEFYVPFLIWPVNDYAIIEYHPVHFPFNIKFYDYFNNEVLGFSEYLEKLVLLMLVHQVVVDDVWINSESLHNVLCLINELNFLEPKFIDFEWYLNYVVKRKLYYENNIKDFKKYESIEKKNELNLYNDIIKDELDLYKKLEIYDDLKIKNIHNLDEKFFNMCTDDLKQVLNFWISRNKKMNYNDA